MSALRRNKPLPRYKPLLRQVVQVPLKRPTPSVVGHPIHPRAIQGGSPKGPVPKSQGRILDPSYLVYVRQRDCCGCFAEGQRTQTQVHHYGPRGVGQKTHDWLTVPLCSLCHRQIHRWGILPCHADRYETQVHLLRTQVYLLLLRFDPRGQWLALLEAAQVAEADTLRAILDLLVAYYSLLGGR